MRFELEIDQDQFTQDQIDPAVGAIDREADPALVVAIREQQIERSVHRVMGRQMFIQGWKINLTQQSLLVAEVPVQQVAQSQAVDPGVVELPAGQPTSQGIECTDQLAVLAVDFRMSYLERL
jgi:hypothetical protein